MRYEIRLACRLRNGDGGVHTKGTTLNVGSTGALVAMRDGDPRNARFGPGDPIRIEILLPPNPMFGQRALACDGKVVRLYEESAIPVIAVQFEQVTFKKVEPGPEVLASMAVM